MSGRDKLYIVSKEALSEVLKKTLYAKELLETKKVANTTEAIKKAGISRGAFYKYKDLIMPFYDMQSEKKITFLMVLEDVKGVLSKILNIMAKYNVNVITIHQNVPIDKVANVTITVEKNADADTLQIPSVVVVPEVTTAATTVATTEAQPLLQPKLLL